MYSLIVTDSSGKVLYRRLRDAGLILEFEGGFGFIDKLDVARYHWVVVDTAQIAA